MFSSRIRAEVEPASESVYQRVLGPAFSGLDPCLQAYFGPIPAGHVGVGRGTYREAGLRVRPLWLLFTVLGRRKIAFAEHGVDVPFTVRNEAGTDGTLNAVRSFRFPRAKRMMTDSMAIIDGRLIDRIGARRELEVELVPRVVDGRLALDSRRLAARILGMRIPLPRLVQVTLREEVAPVDGRAQHVSLAVTAPLLGRIYGYDGTFTYAIEPSTPV